jgi:Mg-chelatase subunit ChlI
MKTTDELEIAGTRVKFEENIIQHDPNKTAGAWWFKTCCYTIDIYTQYFSTEDNLVITVRKDEKLIGSQTIPMTASKDRVLGIISKIISSYNQQLKELEEWADEQSEKDYLF